MGIGGSIGNNQEFIDIKDQYFDSGILNDCKGLSQNAKNLIVDTLKIANHDGKSLSWIVEKIAKDFPDLSSNRARLIARTEMLTASNLAAYLAAAKTGLLYKKEWLTAKDGRVRHSHDLINGTRIDMDDYFFVGNAKILVPGARTQQNGLPTPAKEIVNCRCTVLYHPQRVNGRLVEYNYEMNGIFP